MDWIPFSPRSINMKASCDRKSLSDIMIVIKDYEALMKGGALFQLDLRLQTQFLNKICYNI